MRLPLFSKGSQEVLGRAAARHVIVRDQLIALWESIGSRRSLSNGQATVRQLYPGHALEPLIRHGDADAIASYAEWLPNAPQLIIGQLDPTPFPMDVLAQEPIRAAALAVVDRVWRHATEGIAKEGTEERSLLMSTTAGSVLHCLWPVWHEDKTLRAGIDAWLLDEDLNRFRAALHALEGLKLCRETQDLVVRGIAGQMEAQKGHEGGFFFVFVLPEVLRFIHRTGLTAALEPFIRQLAKSQTHIACHATAVLIPLLDENEAGRVSRAAAEGRWLGRGVEMIDAPLLHRMVELAPDAWANALQSVGTSSPMPLTQMVLPYLTGLPYALLRRVLLAWARSAAGTMEIPWSWEGDDSITSARPADRIRQLLFDHGCERETLAPFPEEA